MANRATTWVRERLATAPAIYGLIVYEVLIAATSDHEPETWGVLELSAISLVVFYLAHAFAETVAAHGATPLRDAIGHGLIHSAGMLYAAVLPTIALIVCGIARVSADDAGDWTLGVGLLVLAYLGYQATAERGRGVWARLLGGLLTAFLGLVIMILDYAVH